VLVFAFGFAAVSFISRQMLQDDAREEVLRNARLMMDIAPAMRAYTVEQVKPHLDKQLRDVFLPQTVPAFAATETLSHIQKKYRDCGYEEATLNLPIRATAPLTGRPISSNSSVTIRRPASSCPNAMVAPGVSFTLPNQFRLATQPACNATVRRLRHPPAC
jgi:hypothetical protein